MNITYVRTPIDQDYDQIFGDTLREYNAKQKRKDRKIDNYLDHIKQSKNNEKIFYENVVQIGKRDDTGILDQDGNITDEALLAREILDEYARTFQERNPNLILFNAVLHMDEATPHHHLDYIPVAHGYKTGLSTRNSLTKGLQEMGIEPAKGKNDNETMHWQQREREFITGLCRECGLDIEVLGIKRDDYSLPEYKAAMREVEAAEAEIEILTQEKEEVVSVLEESKAISERYDNAITEQLKILDSIDDQIKEAELKREQTFHDVSKILDAGKLVTHEVEEIEKKAVEVKPLFGKEPMVKIPRSIFNKLLERYKVAGTFEKLYQDYYGKSYSLQLTVNSLKDRVQELNVKVRQLTSFIEAKGLVASFKVFLKPKPKSIVEALNENKVKVDARKEQPRKVPDMKKRQSPVR